MSYVFSQAIKYPLPADQLFLQTNLYMAYALVRYNLWKFFTDRLNTDKHERIACAANLTRYQGFWSRNFTWFWWFCISILQTFVVNNTATVSWCLTQWSLLVLWQVCIVLVHLCSVLKRLQLLQHCFMTGSSNTARTKVITSANPCFSPFLLVIPTWYWWSIPGPRLVDLQRLNDWC